MTLIQLRYLAAIVDAGLNISAAARQVHASQPGLSKQIKQLEEELGFQLFRRRGKSIEALTASGSEILTSARLILSEAANIQSLSAGRREELGGELRIATTYTQARFVLPAALAQLRARFPDLRLHLAPVSEREALERLDQSAADIAIVSGGGAPATAHLAVPIYRWNLVGLRRPHRPTLRSGRAITLAGLAATPLVTYESALEPASSFARAFRDAGLEFQLACTARDADLIKTYVRAGLGVGVLAEMAVTSDDADLERLDLRGLFPTRTTWVVMKNDRLLRGRMIELVAELAPHLDRRDLIEAFDSTPQPWPQPPPWEDLRPAVRRSAVAT